MAVTEGLSLMQAWWAAPLGRAVSHGAPAGVLYQGRFTQLIFASHGITPLGYAAFAFAFGVTAGALIRRTIPAMAVTLAGLAVVLHPHLGEPGQAGGFHPLTGQPRLLAGQGDRRDAGTALRGADGKRAPSGADLQQPPTPKQFCRHDTGSSVGNPLLCPRDLNTETGEISPDRGKSCNKGNRNGVKARGYSAKCSLFVLPTGWCMAGWQEASAPASLATPAAGRRQRQRLRVLSSWAARAGPGNLP
jgi:hypothetical protein